MIARLARSAKIAAVCASLLAGAAHAQSVTDYNAFLFGSYTGNYSDIEGALAAGGDVSITGYGVGGALPSSRNGTDTLVAGGTLTMNGGQLYQGNAVAGTLNLTGGANILNGTARTGSSGIDFSATQATMLALSASLADEATNGNINWQSWGGYFLTGTETGLNVFNISGADLASTNTFSITAPANSYVLVNVDGSADAFKYAGTSLSGGITASNVLFNFSDASSLSLAGISILGSVLAPSATVDFGNGQFNGTLIAQALTGAGEFHYVPYGGTLLNPPTTSPVPEPAAWAMMIGGFGFAGAFLRRKRQIHALA